ncbi:hypothetical protein P20652_0260 [Pseudoalteromonas sp. BSi20652]|nr:hypothetical protein P20652_0260 [Pseudoalteromonas sp. BSi20652]
MTHIKKLLLAAACSSALLGSNAVFANTAGQNADLKTVATFDAQHPPGNIAITPSGRKFLSVHGFFGQKAKNYGAFKRWHN